MTAAVSIVLPLYRTRGTLPELLDRLITACPWPLRFVLVDDACPEGSAELVTSRFARLPGRLVTLDQNVGQYAAVLAGLRLADPGITVVMDADLQDAPEQVPTLVQRLRDNPEVDLVCAGRRGHYERAGRRFTARVYRRTLWALTGGRVPADAGMFSAISDPGRRRILALGDHAAPLLPAAARAGLRVESLPLPRSTRPVGRSSTTSARRVRAGLSALATVTPAQPLVTRWSPARRCAPAGSITELGSPGGASMPDHNATQIDYFSGRALPRMDPVGRARTPYTQRQLQAVIDAGGIGPSDRIVDVGCGLGKYTIGLAERGLDVTGLDLTPALVERLHRVAPQIPAVVGDLLDPPAELLGGFDVVTGFFMLHHLPDVQAGFAGARRLLAPGGRAVFCEPNAMFPGYYAQITLTPGMSWRGDRGVLNMRARRLRAQLQQAGFQDIRIETFGAFPPALANRSWGRALERRIERLPGIRPVRAFLLIHAR